MNAEQEKEVNAQFNAKTASVTEDDVNKVIGQESKVFSLFKKVGKHAEDFKLLWNLLKDYRSGDYKEVPWKLIASIVFAFVYLVSPVDVIPDVIPFLGFTDDISVFGLVLAGFSVDIEAYKNWKASHTKQLGNN